MVSAASLRASFALLAGLGLQALVVSLGADLPGWAGSLVGLLSAGLLVHGCAIFAEQKGYSPWVGMAGLLSVVGVVVVVLLPTFEAFPRPWRRSAIPSGEARPRSDRRKPSP